MFLQIWQISEEVADLQRFTLSKNSFWYRRGFFVNSAKFLMTLFLKNLWDGCFCKNFHSVYSFCLCLEDKTSWRCFCNTSWRRLEDVFKTSWNRLGKTSWRHLEDVFKMSWKCLQDVWPRRIYWSWPRRLEDVLETSSEDVWVRQIYSSWSRGLLKTKKKDVFKRSSSRRMFAGLFALEQMKSNY